MAEPKVLDANGREIEPGSVVRDGDLECVVMRICWVGMPRPELLLTSPIGPGVIRTQQTEEPGTYTCPDLVLLDDNENEAASSCPEKGSDDD